VPASGFAAFIECHSRPTRCGRTDSL
jgi:hypothetical protein